MTPDFPNEPFFCVTWTFEQIRLQLRKSNLDKEFESLSRFDFLVPKS